jgi:triphosphoribosyl-dephospho-CoA synthase
MNDTDLLALHAQLACIYEATARKPGNVHRFCDFDDAGYLDFLTSAAAVAPVLAGSPARAVGDTILDAVKATRLVAGSNTNLGVILLLGPLAAAAIQPDYRANVVGVLESLTIEDAQRVYESINLARPGGMGKVAEQDLSGRPTISLREAMALAADRDLIARQYANGFEEVFAEGAPALLAGAELAGSLEGAILYAQLVLMSRHPDSLIARKVGLAEARESMDRAGRVLALGWPKTLQARAALVDLDGWLRGAGRRRNPGTTADLIAASLFVLLRQRRLPRPPAFPWSLPENGEKPALPTSDSRG